ncbi:MAG: DUF5009 domain-containing protein [Kiritimatiellae bacterium]|nr:DUF5009 domain-containing protein [Kiritimatiellia bacterium]
MDNGSNERLVSLDALRGFDMLFIMGLSGLVVAVCAAFGFGDCFLVEQMRHVKWHGLTHHDTIFPLFLFIAGVAFPFSFAAQAARGRTRAQICLKIFRRAVALVLLGAVYNGMLRDGFGGLRWASVLGRIGLAWAGAGLLYVFCGVRTRLAVAAAILVGYGLVLALVPAPDAPPGADPFSLEGNVVGWIDRRLLPGRLHLKTFDPEGLLSTLPAVVTAMLGTFCGELIRSASPTGGRKAALMAAAAAVLALAAALFAPVCPVNKSLWTPTFVLAAGAYSVAMLALFYWVVDVKGWRRWTFPLRVVGMNAIAIYMMQGIFDFRKAARFFFGGLSGAVPEAFGPVVLAAGYMAVCWLVLLFMYRKNAFLKV